MELNATPSTALTFGFILITLLLASWWIWLTGRAYANFFAEQTQKYSKTNTSRKATLWATVIILSWLGLTAMVSFQDWAHNFDSFPPPALRVLLILIAITMLFAFLKPGKVISQQTPIWLLIGFQTFRVPLELLIHQAYAENITIIEMTYLGRNFDIVTGVLALLLAIYSYRHALSNWVILLWNLLGLGLLLNVVATGIFSLPHPMQLVETNFPNVWITYFPFIWLPSLLVCSALFGHLLVFRYLTAQRKSPAVLNSQLNTD